MKRLLFAVLAGLLLTGCTMKERNTVIGAGVGAGVGALIGSATGGPTGLWVGAGIGSIAGGAIGSMVRPEPCYIRDKQGRVWQVACRQEPY